ncbi:MULTISPECIES: glycosyltransferase family 2 protein [Lactobacillales]|uniref:glycosyltransferase family 2 protein n=1 Tax=Lactobacillales TaxID=186826 RepID=UPI001B52E7BC|nr:glycosyltransferase family A protein [Tetragenococcus halophilus]GFK25256.1 glycosyl transferase [Tetragenococcus halophilus]
MQISIVIPMYNSASYIQDLLQDLKNQTSPNFKIIIVDDCSDDNSVKTVENMRIPNLSLISLDCNVGRSEARNIGLTYVETDFVVFIDSDDRVSRYFIEDFEKIHEFSPDSELLIIGWTNKFSGLKVLPSKSSPKILSSHELMLDILNDKKVYYSLWNKAFSVDKIRENGITFPKFIYSEDLTFIFNYVTKNMLITAVIDTQQVDYYWRPTVSKHQTKDRLSIDGNSTNAFDENYGAIKVLRQQLLTSENKYSKELLCELDYILIQEYVHTTSLYSKSEFFPMMANALKAKVSIVQKIRLVFNYLFGTKLESIVYWHYMKLRDQNS